jgi:ribosomal protein L37AE/L43A
MTRTARQAHRAHMDALHLAARQIVAAGRCPDCGSPLRRNLALAGWWQCSQYGAEGFRADASRPACAFQTFTE